MTPTNRCISENNLKQELFTYSYTNLTFSHTHQLRSQILAHSQALHTSHAAQMFIFKHSRLLRKLKNSIASLLPIPFPTISHVYSPVSVALLPSFVLSFRFPIEVSS